jgi:hypothetical protein
MQRGQEKDEGKSVMEELETFSLDHEVAAGKLLEEWNQCKEQLAFLFKNRDSERAGPLMKRAILLFEQFLFLSNSLDKEKYSITNCKIKPVNVEERLDFILSRPKLFHSYKQLAELFAEQEKQFAKQIVLNKTKSKRPE